MSFPFRGDGGVLTLMLLQKGPHASFSQTFCPQKRGCSSERVELWLGEIRIMNSSECFVSPPYPHRRLGLPALVRGNAPQQTRAAADGRASQSGEHEASGPPCSFPGSVGPSLDRDMGQPIMRCTYIYAECEICSGAGPGQRQGPPPRSPLCPLCRAWSHSLLERLMKVAVVSW